MPLSHRLPPPPGAPPPGTPTISTGPTPQPVGVSAKLSEAIVKIEKAVIDLGTNLSDRLSVIETKVNKMQESCPSNQSVTKLTDSVSALSSTVSVSVKDIQSSCQAVANVTVSMTDDDMTTISSKVAENTAPEIRKIMSENQAVLDSKVKTLSENISKVESELSGASKEISNLSKNLAGLPTLVSSLQGMINTPGASLNTAPVSGPATEANKTTTEVTGPKTRKCVIFTPSLGKNSDTKRLENDLNC